MQSTRDLKTPAKASTRLPPLGSDAKHYRRTLQAFLASEKHAVEEIRRSLQNKQSRRAMHLANTLTSQAKSLGVFGLYQASSELVHALNAWAAVADALEAALQKTESQLRELKHSLHQAHVLRLSYSSGNALRPHLTEDQARALLGQIRGMVHSNDLGALYLLEQHHLELMEHFGGYLQSVESALKEIDFETARSLLGKHAETLSPPLPACGTASGG